MKSEKTKRNLEMVKMRRAGFSYDKIAAAFGVNKKTAYEIILRKIKKRVGI